MEFNDIANVGATHRTHCDCNPLHRHVHKCAYASATGTMSAWYKTCITFSIKTNWTASRGRRCGIIAADDDDDTALPVDDVAAAAAARRDGRSRRRRRLVELGRREVVTLEHPDQTSLRSLEFTLTIGRVLTLAHTPTQAPNPNPIGELTIGKADQHTKTPYTRWNLLVDVLSIALGCAIRHVLS